MRKKCQSQMKWEEEKYISNSALNWTYFELLRKLFSTQFFPFFLVFLYSCFTVGNLYYKKIRSLRKIIILLNDVRMKIVYIKF